MCLHGGTFLAGKPSRQTDFTAGSTTTCQRCHAKMGYNPGLLVEKQVGMVALGTFHHTTLDWDNWAPASLVVLRMQLGVQRTRKSYENLSSGCTRQVLGLSPSFLVTQQLQANRLQWVMEKRRKRAAGKAKRKMSSMNVKYLCQDMGFECRHVAFAWVACTCKTR